MSPSAVIDEANGKLLAVTENGANSDKPALFRCNLDGTGCTYSDISAGQGTGSGFHPRAVIDAANGKLLVVTDDFANADKPALFRCNLDGTGCTYTDISAGQGRYSGVTPSVVIDEANGKLLAVTENGANSGRVALFRCSLDGTSCTYSDLGSLGAQGHEPSIVVDAANATLLVATSFPGLLYCKIDGTLCSFTWIPPEFPTDLGADPGASPSAVIDTIHSRLLIATDNRSNSDTPAVFRSSLGGNDWSFTTLSAGQPAGSGYRPSAVIDAVHQRLLVVTEDHGNLDKPGLFSVALW